MRTAFVSFLLAALTVAIYARVATFGFINFDDPGYVADNAQVLNGLTRYGANSGDVGSTIGASGSLGGGVKVPVGKRVAFRFDLRGYATLQDAAVSVTCGPGCFVNFSANGWYQIAGTVGLAIRL